MANSMVSRSFESMTIILNKSDVARENALESIGVIINAAVRNNFQPNVFRISAKNSLNQKWKSN